MLEIPILDCWKRSVFIAPTNSAILQQSSQLGRHFSSPLLLDQPISNGPIIFCFSWVNDEDWWHLPPFRTRISFRNSLKCGADVFSARWSFQILWLARECSTTEIYHIFVNQNDGILSFLDWFLVDDFCLELNLSRI